MIRKAVLCVLLLLSVCGTAFAHPHVFLDASVTVDFDNQGFAGVKNRWTYDEIYSAAMISSVDDGDGILSEKETNILRQEILDPIVKENYYNYVLLGTKFLTAEKIKDFKVKFENRRLILEFEVGFSVPVTADYTMLVVVVADPSNYIQMTTDLENAEVEAPDFMEVDYFNDSLRGMTMFKAFRSEIEGLFLRFKK
ncbi:MAG: DUF1007 family protein [Fibrobacter sp.]|nr:DUF1007 family protein [Fibrobacter sp.]